MNDSIQMDSNLFIEMFQMNEELFKGEQLRIGELEGIEESNDWSSTEGLGFANFYLSNFSYRYADICGFLVVSPFRSECWDVSSGYETKRVNKIISAQDALSLIELLKEIEEGNTEYAKLAEDIRTEMTELVIERVAHTYDHLALLSVLLTRIFSDKVEQKKETVEMRKKLRKFIGVFSETRAFNSKRLILALIASPSGAALSLFLILGPNKFTQALTQGYFGLLFLIWITFSLGFFIEIGLVFNLENVPREQLAIDKKVSAAFSGEVLVLLKGSNVKPDTLFIEFPHNETLAKLFVDPFFSSEFQDKLNKNLRFTFPYNDLPPIVRDKFVSLVKENSYETYKQCVKQDNLGILWKQLSAYLTESVEYAVSEYTEETCIPKERSIASNKELIDRAELELSLHREERAQAKELKDIVSG